MKKHVFIALTLVAGLAACSQPKENKEVHSDVDTVLMATTDVSAALTEVSDESPSPEEDTTEEARLPLKKRVLASDEAEQLFTQYDLAPLWNNDVDGPYDLPYQNRDETSSLVGTVHNGFYGKDHYRIELYVASITKDQQNAAIYHIKGKTRFKKNIVPFEGVIQLDSIVSCKDLNKDVNQENQELFMTTGTFELKEEAHFQGAGIFKGKVSIIFGLNKEQRIESRCMNENGKWNCDWLLDGIWKSNTTKQTKPVLIGGNFLHIAEQVLQNFNVGEREVEINPKYRSLGWDTYWSNEEWWHQAEI